MSEIREPRRRLSPTALRLGGAFAAVLALFGAALVATLAMMDRTAQAEAEVAHLDHAKHSGHMAAALVREQYIHQAHTIIEWNQSHLGHYGQVVERAQKAVAELVGHARTDEERALANEVDRLSRESDREFRQTIVPAVIANDHEAVVPAHDRLESTVERVVQLNEQLNARFEHDAADALLRAETFRARARLVVLICFGLALLVAAVVGALTVRSVLRPIAALDAGARRVAAGDFDARITVQADDELGALARTFNQMSEDLGRQRTELLRAHRLASIGQIAAGVAHEINNPLGVILGYVKLMQRSASGSAADELRVLEDETRQCQRIVQGLLDLARSSRLQCAPVDLAEIARDAVARMEEVGAASVRVAGPPPDARAPLVGDPSKLRQVTANLLANAVEATPAGGVVRIEASTANGDVLLSVSDSGPGIAADAMPRLFEPFFTTKPRGTGLGLAISNAIIEAHGGQVAVDRSPEGGARFAVRLPARGPVVSTTSERPA